MTTIDPQVSASGDDWERTDTTFTNNSYRPYIGWASTAGQYRSVGFRVAGLSGLGGATITAAYVRIWTYVLVGNGGSCIIKAEDAEAPVAPTTAGEWDTKLANSTTATVTWEDIPDADGYTNSPSIVSIIQELCDSYDPSAIAIYLDANGYGSDSGDATRILNYDNSTPRPPILHIEYTAASGTQYDQSVAGAITPSGTIVNRAGKVLAGAVTPAGVVLARAGKVLAGALVSSGSVVKRVSKFLSGALAFIGDIVASLVSGSGATPQVTLTLPERRLTFTLDVRDFASYLTGAILTEAGELIFTEAGDRLETEASTESGSGFSLHERALTLTLEKKP